MTVINHFANAPLLYRVEGTAAHAYTKVRGDTVALADTLVKEGPPHTFTYGGAERNFDPEIDWEWLEILRNGQVELNEKQLKLLRDPTLPGGPAIEWIASHDFHPVLRLKDPRGAFALLETPEFEADLIESGYKRHGLEYFRPLDKVDATLTFLLELGWTLLDPQGRTIHLLTSLAASVETVAGEIAVEATAHFGDFSAPLEEGMLMALDDHNVGLLPPDLRLVPRRLPRSHIQKIASLLARPETTIDPALSAKTSPPSPDFTATLRPYQQEGVDWLCHLHDSNLSALLADDMGLGKTVQVIAFLSRLPIEARHLVVAPTSLLHNWRAEVERFLPTLPVTIHHGPERASQLPTGLIITSYGTLLADIDLFSATPFHALILDEAQAIKNPASKIHQAACQLQANFRISLTGTPIENSINDLLAHFRFLQPDVTPDLTNPYILRRTKSQVLTDLPPKIEQTLTVPLHDEQQQLYDEMLETPPSEILELVLRLRQLCCHPELLGLEAPSAKFDAILNDLASLTNHKVLIFSQFTSFLHLLAPHLPGPHLLLEGATKNRQALVDQFQNDPDIPFFLISLKAGGTGLNLTAADTVLICDPWWNQAAENQAIDRAHRIGQNNAVTVKRYIAEKTIEEKVQDLQHAKLDLAKLIS